MKSLHVQGYAPETLVTGSMDGRVRVWDASSGKFLKSFRPSDSSGGEASSEASWSETVVPLGGVSNSASVMVPPKQAPILCVRVGSTRVLTSHTDGSLALCQFQI
jgi:WD40 repeat protein